MPDPEVPEPTPVPAIETSKNGTISDRAILSLFGHRKSVAFCCLLPPFLRPAKTPVHTLKRCELVGAGEVAFFEGFVKRLPIAVSSLSDSVNRRREEAFCCFVSLTLLLSEAACSIDSACD